MIKFYESNIQEINMQNILCYIYYYNKVQLNDKEVMVNIFYILRYIYRYTLIFNL